MEEGVLRSYWDAEFDEDPCGPHAGEGETGILYFRGVYGWWRRKFTDHLSGYAVTWAAASPPGGPMNHHAKASEVTGSQLCRQKKKKVTIFSNTYVPSISVVKEKMGRSAEEAIVQLL